MTNTPPQVPLSHQANQPEEVHLRDYLNVIIRRRKSFLATFLLVFFGVALVTFTMKPVYEAAATLHVKDDRGQAGLLSNLFLMDSVNPINAEMEILKSFTLAEQVVKRLHLDWQVSRRSDGLTFRLLEFSSTAKEPSYRVELTDAESYTVRDVDGAVVGTGRTGELMRGKGGVTLLISDLRGKAGDSFRLELLPFDATAIGLQSAFRSAEAGKLTNIVKLSYRDTDPGLARDVVNTLVQAYLEQNVAFKAEEASRTVGFVEEQLTGLRSELDAAEKNLQSYKSASGVVKLDTEAEELVRKLSETERQRAGIALQRKQSEFALASLKDAMRRGGIYSPAVMRDDPLVAGLTAKLSELEVQKRALLAEATESHPAVKAAQAQIEEVQNKLQATYETALKNLARQETEVERQLAGYEGGLKALPVAERELARLTRVAKVDADIYTLLLQKREEARIAKATAVSNIHVVDPARTPHLPVKPQKAKNLLLGLLVGCMLAVGFAFFREYLDDTIKGTEQAKRLLGLPLLGVIPFLKPGEENDSINAVSLLATKSAGAEALRKLRTALHFTSRAQDAVLLVTSAFSAEGKSTVSSNLGILLTQNGARVLLIDCDLRRPSLHRNFNHSQVPGLTEIITGDATLAGAIHSTGVDGLDFVSAGTIPPNPADLLGSDAMRRLLEEARGRYDRIILDAPPVLAVADTPVLSSLADHGLVVMEMERVPVKAAQELREILQATGMRVSGFVLNDKKNNGRVYGYSYGYYGDGDQREEQPSAKLLWGKFFKF